LVSSKVHTTRVLEEPTDPILPAWQGRTVAVQYVASQRCTAAAKGVADNQWLWLPSDCMANDRLIKDWLWLQVHAHSL